MLTLANQMVVGTFMQGLSIRFTEFGDDFLKATMSINESMHQPFGYLHGGVTISFCESVASMASFLLLKTLNIDSRVSTINVSSNHIRSVKKGILFAKASKVHIGRLTHIWDVEVRDDKNNLLNISKITNIVH